MGESIVVERELEGLVEVIWKIMYVSFLKRHSSYTKLMIILFNCFFLFFLHVLTIF